MRNLVWVIVMLLVVSCNRPQTNAVEDKGENQPWFLSDSLYKFHDYKGVLADMRKDELTAIDSNAVKFLHSKTEGFNADYWWIRQYHYFSKQQKTDGLQPIIIKETGDDYWAYLMIILNEKNEVVSCKEIQGGSYGGPENYSDRMELEYNFCDIRDEHRIDFFRIKEIYPSIDSDHVVEKPTMHDSISYTISINKLGQFKTEYIDSLRLADR